VRTDSLQSLYPARNTRLPDGREVAPFCSVKRGGSDLDRAPYEHCVLETTSGNSGKFLKILKQNVLNG
jgi:hypothetical protein